MAFKTFNAGDVLTAADMNTYLMNQAVISCTSGSRPGSPTDGMVIYETDTDKMLLREGTVWRRIPKDLETPDLPATAFEPANDTTAATSYTSVTNHGVAFTAPPLGKVYVTFRCALGTNSVVSTAGSWLGFEVRTGTTIGSGTVVLAADDTRAAGPSRPFNTNAGFKYHPAAGRELVTGLTAGSPYHVRTMFKSEGTATAAVLNRSVLVEPVL